MAEQIVKQTPLTVSTTDQYVLGAAAKGRQGAFGVSIKNSGATFSITVKGRARGTSNTPLAIPYKKYALNGAAGDNTYVSTAITGDSLIEIPSTNMDVVLDFTAITGGTVEVRFEPVVL